MATTAAVLNILVRAETRQALRELRRVDSTVKSTGNTVTRATRAQDKHTTSTQRMGRAATSAIGFAGGFVGVYGLVNAFKATVSEARESNKVTAQTQAVLKSMGGSANVTAKEVEKLANKISLKAGIDDEAIQSSENLLLTFTNLRNEAGKGNKIFDQTTRVVADMSAALGQDLKSSSIQLGKALNDPSVGLTALRRVGVSFNATQTETIQKLFETGNQLKAQKLILRELNNEFKGSAAAQADPFDKLGVALENIQEAIGKAILPTMAKWANVIAKFINQMNTGKGAGGDFADILRVVGKVLGWLIPAMVKVGKVMAEQVSKRVQGVIAAFTWLIQAGKNVVGWFKTAWADLGDVLVAPFRGALSLITGFINKIIDVINVLPGVDIGHVGGGDTSTAGTGQQGRPHPGGKGTQKKQKGGAMVPGFGSGDRVPAMLEPGEYVLNRQAVKAVGLQNLEKTNKTFPRFQAGGGVGGPLSDIAGGVGDVVGKLPGTGGFPSWLQGTGDYVLAAMGKFIKDHIPKIPSLGGTNIGSANGLQAGIRNILGVVLGNTSGLSISSGLRPGDSGSFHSLGRAVDLSGSPGAMLTAASWIDKHIGPALTEGIHNPNLSWDTGHRVSSGFWGASTWADHIDHIHLAKQKGGLVFPPNTEGPAWYDRAYDFYKKFAKPGPYQTDLGPQGEAKFREWVAQQHVPFDVNAHKVDYDMRGFWKGGHHWTGGHFPDTFKTPYDTTFSRQSRYATANNPFDWRGNKLVNTRSGRVITKSGQKGGLVAMLQKGGQISPNSPNRPVVGDQWLKGVGGHWDPNEIFTALRQLGAPKDMAAFLSAVSVGESGGNPRAVGHDPGGSTGLGLLQMTVGVGNDSLINRYGGRAGMLNPWQNMLAAMELYRSSGPGAWFGHQGGRGHLLLDRIAGPTKTPGTKKNKKKKPAGGGGSDWLSDLLQSGEDRFAMASELADAANIPIASANELIGEGNLEALQRFQVGASQSPILGLARPGMPTPASLIPNREPWEFLNQASTSTVSPGVSSAGVSSVGVNNVTPQGDLMGGTLPKRGRRRKAATVIHNHLYIDGKELDTRTRKVQRRTARGGHRPLPSRGGGL